MRKNTLIIILTVIVTLAVISGLVVLCMYNALIGVAVFVVLCLAVLFYLLYKSKKLNTVEKYIASKNRAIRPLMQNIHELVLETVPNIIPFIGDLFGIPQMYPTYLYMRGTKYYHLISQQAIIGGKSICIYPHNPLVFEVFSDFLRRKKSGL